MDEEFGGSLARFLAQLHFGIGSTLHNNANLVRVSCMPWEYPNLQGNHLEPLEIAHQESPSHRGAVLLNEMVEMPMVHPLPKMRTSLCAQHAVHEVLAHTGWT
jgi:hypothetical protein